MSTARTRMAAAVVGTAAVVVVGTASIGGMVGLAVADGATADRGTSECRAADVHATYHAVDAATSHRFGRIVLENTSGRACSVRGYGGLSYVGGGHGRQVGAAADRTRSRVPRTVLQPGDRVASAVSETVAGAYPAAECRPTPVDGFRVYLPDETRSLYVAHPTTGCRSDEVDLLEHKAYH